MGQEGAGGAVAAGCRRRLGPPAVTVQAQGDSNAERRGERASRARSRGDCREGHPSGAPISGHRSAESTMLCLTLTARRCRCTTARSVPERRTQAANSASRPGALDPRRQARPLASPSGCRALHRPQAGARGTPAPRTHRPAAARCREGRRLPPRRDRRAAVHRSRKTPWLMHLHVRCWWRLPAAGADLAAARCLSTWSTRPRGTAAEGQHDDHQASNEPQRRGLADSTVNVHAPSAGAHVGRDGRAAGRPLAAEHWFIAPQHPRSLACQTTGAPGRAGACLTCQLAANQSGRGWVGH